MRKQIQIGTRTVAQEEPILISAEAGVTCNYDLKIAKEMIDVVRDSGADAIKFIFWFPEEIMSDKSVLYSYETLDGPVSENMFEMLECLRFSLDEWREIKAYADQKDVIVFCTVNSPSGIAWSEEIGLSAYKLSSWDFNYHPLWRRIAAIGKPVIVDTGPVNTVEVAKVMQIMKDAGNDRSILVHCFHTSDPAEMNMRSIPYLRTAFNSLVGYSSAKQDSQTDITAIALGSVYLEKRLTMSRKLPGHHHILSLEPDEFREYVKLMRSVQASLGVEDLIPSPGDLETRKWAFRHLVANRDIPAGTMLTEEMLEGKRPEAGISPEHLHFFVGRTTKRDLKYNEAMTWDVV